MLITFPGFHKLTVTTVEVGNKFYLYLTSNLTVTTEYMVFGLDFVSGHVIAIFHEELYHE